MNKLHTFLTTLLVAMAATAVAQPHFWLGADISATTEMESRGIKLYNSLGQERENTALMRELGLDAIRLRVWVNPKGGWSSPQDVLVMARRAKALGMAVMIDFHYSDWWADPGKQYPPAAWKGMSYAKMKRALAAHTTETLRLLKRENIDVRWVQIGNETPHGFLWDTGRSETNMKQYAGLTDAGYAAAKKVYPQATCIVHLDAGADLKRYRFVFDGLRQHGARYDMIGMSVYPYWDLEARHTRSEEETVSRVVSNIKTLSAEYGRDVMIVETGYEAKRPQEGYVFMRQLIDAARTQTDGHCHGVFYWAPEAEGPYALGAFDHHRPTAIMEAFTEAARGLPMRDTTLYATSVMDCQGPNGRISGRFYMPLSLAESRNGLLPLVIMAHGFGATHQEPERYAEVLAKHGIAAYVFDFCGGSMRSQSEGKTTDMSIFTEVADLEAVTAAMRRVACVDTTRIALLGCSQGGLVAAITAARHPADYRIVQLIYPAFGIPSTAREMLSKTQDRPDEFEFWGMKLSRKYYEPLVDYDPFTEIGHYEGPVQVVYGDKDNITGGGLMDRAKQTYRQAELWRVDGGEHGFHNLFHHRVAERYVVEYARKQLSAQHF